MKTLGEFPSLDRCCDFECKFRNYSRSFRQSRRGDCEYFWSGTRWCLYESSMTMRKPLITPLHPSSTNKLHHSHSPLQPPIPPLKPPLPHNPTPNPNPRFHSCHHEVTSTPTQETAPRRHQNLEIQKRALAFKVQMRKEVEAHRCKDAIWIFDALRGICVFPTLPLRDLELVTERLGCIWASSLLPLSMEVESTLLPHTQAGVPSSYTVCILLGAG